MDENENKELEQGTETTPEENANDTVDTGRNPDEIRDMIGVLSEQIKTLTLELRAKDPEGTKPKADFGAYFKDFMK